ncbi:hypothetical protein DMX02_29215 [Pseudomonas jessenii]|nr:hypothetical protein DMX02_29215 [Pseudomonas jessenii]
MTLGRWPGTSETILAEDEPGVGVPPAVSAMESPVPARVSAGVSGLGGGSDVSADVEAGIFLGGLAIEVLR